MADREFVGVDRLLKCWRSTRRSCLHANAVRRIRATVHDSWKTLRAEISVLGDFGSSAPHRHHVGTIPPVQHAAPGAGNEAWFDSSATATAFDPFNLDLGGRQEAVRRLRAIDTVILKGWPWDEMGILASSGSVETASKLDCMVSNKQRGGPVLGPRNHTRWKAS